MRLIDADELMKSIKKALGIKSMTKSLLLPAERMIIDQIDNAKTIGGWISVKDGLPDKTDRYMCLCYDFVTKSYWYELLWHENNCWWKSLATLEHDYTKHIVYWMPLPEPPKEVTPWKE